MPEKEPQHEEIIEIAHKPTNTLDTLKKELEEEPPSLMKEPHAIILDLYGVLLCSVYEKNPTSPHCSWLLHVQELGVTSSRALKCCTAYVVIPRLIVLN